MTIWDASLLIVNVGTVIIFETFNCWKTVGLKKGLRFSKITGPYQIFRQIGMLASDYKCPFTTKT